MPATAPAIAPITSQTIKVSRVMRRSFLSMPGQIGGRGCSIPQPMRRVRKEQKPKFKAFRTNVPKAGDRWC
jgi:hypothetical protein